MTTTLSAGNAFLDALAVLLLVVVYFGMASGWVRSRLQAWTRQPVRPLRSAALALSLAVPYLILTITKGGAALFPGLLILAAYLLIPTLLLAYRPRKDPPLDAFDLLAILSLWMPVEFDLLPGVTASVAGTEIPVALLAAVCLGFLLFLVIRPLPDVGYTYRLNPRDGLFALAGLAAFFIPGLILGVGVGFIRFGPVSFQPGEWVARFLAIFFLNALPEEMLFRGGIQNLMQMRWGKTAWTLLAAALIFGLSHINNTTGHHAPPNWPYVAMATLAGLAYGWVWRARGKITASALTHTLVNFIWSVLFTG